MDTDPAAPYASLLRRYQALVVDLLVCVVVLVVAVLVVPEVLEPGPQVLRAVLVGLLVFLLLYEPLLVAVRSGTVGHYRYKLRVVDARSYGRLGFPRALGRAVLKGLLGLLSFVFMLVTRRRQSLHDLAFRSIVILADPEHATALDVAPPLEQDAAYVLPTRWRRITVIAAYALALLVACCFAAVLLVSAECFDDNRCSNAETVLESAVATLWLLATGAVVVLGWRGRLLGCRRRRS